MVFFDSCRSLICNIWVGKARWSGNWDEGNLCRSCTRKCRHAYTARCYRFVRQPNPINEMQIRPRWRNGTFCLTTVVSCVSIHSSRFKLTHVARHYVLRQKQSSTSEPWILHYVVQIGGARSSLVPPGTAPCLPTRPARRQSRQASEETGICCFLQPVVVEGESLESV